MKVVIADDEEHVREGIELAVDWEQFGITECLMAENGDQAMSLIREHNPGVLFCDMSMPVMDGKNLLSQLREEGWETQVIVVSGYDDFDYTRAAIRANGVDYILKPFRKRDLEQALERAVASWQSKEQSMVEEREKGFRVKQADALLDEQRLAALLRGEAAFHEGIQTFFYKFGLPLERLQVALVLPRNRIDIVERRFRGDGELFLFAVNNIAHESLKPHGMHYMCRLDEYQWALLMAFEEKHLSLQERRRRLDKAAEAWRSILGLEVLMGMCDTETEAASLVQAVGKARAALLNTEIIRSPSRDAPVKEVPRLTDQQFLLQAALDNRNKTYAAEILRTHTKKLAELGTLRLKDLQLCTIEANLLLERSARQRLSGKDDISIMLPLWISDLKEWEQMLVQNWWTLMEEEDGGSSGNGGIQAIHDYLQTHFHEDISLTSLSERFHFSPQYIAKKFKELYRSTVMTYLTELRVDKAKSLLIHTDKPISEIANTLGYADENYFGKVFKKLTGYSPLSFRKQHKHS